MSSETQDPNPGETNREKIVRLETKVDRLIKCFDNHLAHHKSLMYALVGVAGTIIVALIVKS